MTFFVTGATGFLGRHVVNGLKKAHGWKSLVCLMHDVQMPREDRPTIVLGDVLDLPFLRRTLARYEISHVVHLAAQTQVQLGQTDPTATFDVNVRGTWNVLEACRLEKVKRCVIASSDKAYGNGENLTESAPLVPTCPYGTSKAAADLIAQSFASNYGMSIAITRCGNLYGPGDTHFRRLVPHVARSLVRGKHPVLRSDGSGIRDWLYVEDAARAYTILLENEHVGPVNVAGGEPTRTAAVVAMLRVATGTTNPMVQVASTGAAELVVQTLDCSLARSLGWVPQVSLSEGLKRAVEWYRGNADECHY